MLICRRQFLFAFVVFFSTSIQAESVVEEIIAAWKIREARYHTGHIEFENVETYHHKLATDPDDPAFGFDGTAPLKHLIIFDNNRGRYTRNGLSLDMNTGRWIHQEYTTAFDGKVSSAMYNDQFLAKHPPGFIEKRSSIYGEGWDWHPTAVLMAFRPMTKSLQGLNPKELGEPVRRAVVNGRDAVVFIKGKFEYSFDPQREYVLLRQEKFSPPPPDGMTRLRLDVNYRIDPEWGVVPEDWSFVKLVTRRPDLVLMTIQGKITKLEFNQPVSRGDFTIQFPPGAVVSDGVNKRNYVVRKDGSARKYDRAEKRAGVTYDEMMTTVAPSVVAERKKRYWFFAVIALVGAIAFWFYRRL